MEVREELVGLARHGDRGAFESLVGRMIGRLQSVAALILHDPKLADAAVQEALVRVWRDLPRLREVERFEECLLGALARTSLDLLQREGGEIQLAPLSGMLVDRRLETEVADRGSVDRTLRQLTPQHRAVLALHLHAGLTLAEVARILTMPADETEALLERAQRAMLAAVEADARWVPPGTADAASEHPGDGGDAAESAEAKGLSSTPEAGIQAALQSWLHSHPSASERDVLFGVMAEAETVDQQGSVRAWLSWFTDSPTGGWMVAVGAVAGLALVFALVTSEDPGEPIGSKDSTAVVVTPTPTTATSDVLPVADLVDRLVAGWSSGDAVATSLLYAESADYRAAIGSGEWNRQYHTRQAIVGGINVMANVDFRMTLTGPILQEHRFVAFPFAWSTATEQRDAIAVMQVVDGSITQHYVIATETGISNVKASSPPVDVTSLLDAELAAMNRGDGDANAAYYAPSAEWRIMVRAGVDPTELYQTRSEIAATTEDRAEIFFRVTRTGWMLQQGDLVVYSWYMHASVGQANGFAVFHLDPDKLIAQEWSVGE